MANEKQAKIISTTFKLAAEMIRTIDRRDFPENNNLITVSSTLILTHKIEDDEEREMMLQIYRGAIREIYPVLAEQSGVVIRFSDDAKKRVYEAGIDTACRETMQHIQAIFEGKHRWSSKLRREEQVKPTAESVVKGGVLVMLRPTYLYMPKGMGTGSYDFLWTSQLLEADPDGVTMKVLDNEHQDQDDSSN